MHISDGILSGEVCIASAGAAVAIAAYSLKKTSQNDIPRIAVMTAAFFVASLIHIKIGPTSAHLLLNGLVGIILGISSFPAILVALVFHTIMFQHGGITTLGVNAIVMGVPALCASLIFKIGNRKPGTTLINSIISFLAGFFSIMLSAILLSLFLAVTGKEFYETAKVIIAIHIPVSLVEGLITLFVISFLQKVKPGMLQKK